MKLDEWINAGLENGWCGPPVCYTHDCLPLAEFENAEFEDGGDPCVHIMRLYANKEMADLVEDNHAPSILRKSTW